MGRGKILRKGLGPSLGTSVAGQPGRSKGGNHSSKLILRVFPHSDRDKSLDKSVHLWLNTALVRGLGRGSGTSYLGNPQSDVGCRYKGAQSFEVFAEYSCIDVVI